jgi:hypothetical protein
MTLQEHTSNTARENNSGELWPYEQILAHSIKDVVADLCLSDASTLITYICNDHHANIDDLIMSSSELFFKEGSLTYGHAADVSFEWGKSPVVTLDMEFMHISTTVFFKLVLHGFYVGIAIQHMLLGTPTDNADTDMRQLEDALADARLSPLPYRL